MADSLNDDWQIWHEPEIQRSENNAEKPYRPDFILLHEQHGLFVLEVKGWTLERIKEVRSGKKRKDNPHVTELLYDFHDGEQWVEAPFDQLGKYKREIRHQLKRRRDALGLSAKQVDKLFDGAVAFANISSMEVKKSSGEIDADRLSIKRASVLSTTRHRVLYKSGIDAWEVQRESAERDLSAPNGGLALSPEKIDIIRGVVHPEICLPPSPRPRRSDVQLGAPWEEVKLGQSETVKFSLVEQERHRAEPPEKYLDELRVLSQAQERVAKYEIGSGHRILFGVAGSGKTMILIARARWQAMLNPSHGILVLCFNRALSLYIAKVLEDFANIDVMTFHAWARERLGFELDFGDEEYDSKLLEYLREFGADKYDSILIDECQDWRPDWFRAALFAAKDQVEGDFLIVGDGSQSIYRKHSDFRWEDCGINPQPWRGNDLEVSIVFDRNYRNTRQIVALASSFARSGKSHGGHSGKGILSLLPDPDECIRGDGPKPKLGFFSDRVREMEFVAKYIRWLINSIETLEPCDFAVVYPGHFGARKAAERFGALLENLEELSIPHVHVQGGEKRNQEMLLEGNSVKVLNIKQMKGLEQRVCFVVGIDEYWEKEEDLLYVAMTRATDWLFLSWSVQERTPIIDRLKADLPLYSWHEEPLDKKKTVSAPRTKTGHAGINEILDCLNTRRVRCTYSAVADYLGIGPLDVSRLLGKRRPEASWVVSKNSHLPTGYSEYQFHPELCKNEVVITTGTELVRLLESCRKKQD